MSTLGGGVGGGDLTCDQCAQIKSEFFMLSTSGLHITLLKSPNISTLHCRRAVGRVGSAAGAAVGGVPSKTSACDHERV
jgi:hypothetical protein